MSIEVAISHVEMVIKAFPNNLELQKMALRHCEALMQPAPKATTASKRATPSAPAAPKDKLTNKAVLTNLRGKIKGQDASVVKSFNKKVNAIWKDAGYKSMSAIPDSDQKTLASLQNLTPEASGFEVLSEEVTRKDVKDLFSKLCADGFTEECKRIRKEVSGEDSLGNVTNPDHFKEMIRRANEELVK